MFSILTSLVSNLFLWFWLLGIVLLRWGTKKNPRVRLLGIIILLVFWFVGTRPFADIVLSPLENVSKPPDIASLQRQEVKQVVVLTGGGYPIQGELFSSALPHGSAYRFLGGVELCARLGTDCRIIFSGSSGRGSGAWPTGLWMKDLALILMPNRQILAEARSHSTGDHSVNIKPFLQKAPFALVTSAYHMPRAVRTFKKAGLDPIPYPVDFLVLGGGYTGLDFIPSIENLSKLNVALREYLALLFYTVTGR
jgi:uncharacterized SAM-binding protein YcdF (DUF218 family)